MTKELEALDKRANQVKIMMIVNGLGITFLLLAMTLDFIQKIRMW
jgi:hypothetical protein